MSKIRGQGPRTTVDDYVEHTVNNLLFTGLFVPMLDVHCSNCRVESQVSPRDLDTSIQCEFCGESLAKLQSGH